MLFYLIFLLGIFLRFYKLKENFYFDGEIGDNLLDVKNAYLHRIIPLLGPPTSHPWLSFGPLFYWIFEPIFILSHFSPFSYGYFGAFIGSLTILVNYYFFSRICNKKIALILSFCMSISPLFLEFSRASRFFSFVLLFVPIFIFTAVTATNEKKHLFLLGILFGLMLNFHYTPFILFPFLVSIFFFKKIRIFLKDTFAFIGGVFIPLIPFIFYDALHKFYMLSNLFLWIPYRILGFFGLYHKNTLSQIVLKENVFSFSQFFSSVFANLPPFTGVIIFLLLTGFSVYFFCSVKKNRTSSTFFYLLLWGGWGIVAIFIHGAPPPHYFVPILMFPLVICSYLLGKIWDTAKNGKILVCCVLGLLLWVNLSFFFSSSWINQYQKNPFSYEKRLKAAAFIIKNAQGRKYALKRVGYNDQFPHNYAQNYIYLLWYLGNEPVHSAQITYIIYEDKKYFPTHVQKNDALFYISSDIAIMKKNHI
jgi:4-amino-4-deoxy-L-arabinose transferase-like glycosyltransferase